MKSTTASTQTIALAKPNPQAVYNLIDNLQITDYSGKKRIPLYQEETNSYLSILELYFCAIESGLSALSLPSFDAALNVLVNTLLEEGDNIVTYNSQAIFKKQFNQWLHLGIQVKKPTHVTLENFKQEIDAQTKLIYLETVSENHEIPDFQKIIAHAKSLNIPVVVDNSVMGPGYGFNPLKEKVDLVLYNTKHWLSKDAGPTEAVIIEGNHFNWFSEHFPKLKKAAAEQRYTNQSQHTSHSLLQFIRKDVPAIQYSEKQQNYLSNALLNIKTAVLKKYDITWEIGKWLKQNKWIDKLNYVGTFDNPNHFKALTYFQNGYGNYLSFQLHGSKEDFIQFQHLIGNKYASSPFVEFSFQEAKKEVGVYIKFGDIKIITELFYQIFDEYKPSGYSSIFYF